ncbi:Helicase conserved domain containing protein, partial [Reticulomyxa filosa]
PEVDVANGIGVIQALQNCKSVKPVVLISYTALGNRMNCVKDLARTLVSIIQDIENHIRTFSYVFIKVPEDQKEFMSGYMETAYNSIKNEGDEGFKAILADIVKKTRNGVTVPNLLKDSPHILLEELSNIRDFIQEPGDVFKPFASKSSKGAVQIQVQKHKENIWLAYQNGDYSVAKIKVDELTDLNNGENAKSMFNERIASPHLSKNDVLAYQK